MGFSFNKIKDQLYHKLIKEKNVDAPSFSELEKLAIEEVQNARSNFDDADEDTVDLAIYQLMAAEERLNLLIKERKKKQ